MKHTQTMWKRLCVMVLGLLIILTALTGCSRKADRVLLEQASPDTSALYLCTFDGETLKAKWLFDRTKEKEIIRAIDSLKTREVKTECINEMKAPYYGLQITDKQGNDISLTYSSGYWLTQDGKVYKAAYDFEQAIREAGDEEWENYTGGFYMPNSGILGKYDLRFLAKSPELEATKNGVTLSFVSMGEDSVTVRLQNDSDETFFYGTYYSLQKEINGVWYILPHVLNGYGFNDIGILLEPGESTEEVCSLVMYGELEAGHYRIEKEGLAAEFSIP